MSEDVPKVNPTEGGDGSGIPPERGARTKAAKRRQPPFDSSLFFIHANKDDAGQSLRSQQKPPSGKGPLSFSLIPQVNKSSRGTLQLTQGSRDTEVPQESF